MAVEHASLGAYVLTWLDELGPAPRTLFTDNETNSGRLFGSPARSRYTKDAFHRWLIAGDAEAVHPEGVGTKACFWQRLELPANGSHVLRLRLAAATATETYHVDARGFDALFELRRREAETFHFQQRSAPLTPEERKVVVQADAGLLWSRQFYHYIVEHWAAGDPAGPAPPAGAPDPSQRRMVSHLGGRYHRRARQMGVPVVCGLGPRVSRRGHGARGPPVCQATGAALVRRALHAPRRAIARLRVCFGDANPPLLAWSAWRVYQLAGQQGDAYDRTFLEQAFHKCIVNFSWWVNRKDVDDNHLFSGGFLGLDNIGVFDRSKPLPGGGHLEQADATAWMAFYATTMLAMAIELAKHDAAYADIAGKFFEHFMAIAWAMNTFRGQGLWDEDDGSYYDRGLLDGRDVPLRIRSMVGLIPLFAAETLDVNRLQRLPQFRERVEWVFENRPQLTRDIACLHGDRGQEKRLLAVPQRERLIRVLRYLLDEAEFLSPYGVRSLSKYHEALPFELQVGGARHQVRYSPGPSESPLFGGNSNWRGPIWFPVNYLLIEALKRHHHFYGKTLQVECPVGSGQYTTLLGVAEELERRLARLFLPGPAGSCPWQGQAPRSLEAPIGAGLALFHECFHGDTGQGLGASHQTGWTALISNVLTRVALSRARR